MQIAVVAFCLAVMEVLMITSRLYVVAVVFPVIVLCFVTGIFAAHRRIHRRQLASRGAVDVVHRESGVDCSICLEPLKEGGRVRRLSCTHVFHIECEEAWHEHGRGCAVCRDGDARTSPEAALPVAIPVEDTV